MNGEGVKWLRALAQHIETAEKEMNGPRDEWSTEPEVGPNPTVQNLRRVAKHLDELEQEVRDFRRDAIRMDMFLKKVSHLQGMINR